MPSRFTGSAFLLCWLMFVLAGTAAPWSTRLSDSLSSLLSDKNNNKLISFPLIPHHVQRSRRRELLWQQQRHVTLGDDTNERHVEKLTTQSHRRRRRRRHLDGAQVIDALYQGYGTHYVDLWCGTPRPQRQTVIVDTGSGMTAFPCLGCTNCGDDGEHHIDHLYNQSISDTFRPLNCTDCQRGSCNHKHGPKVGSSSPTEDECRLGMSYQEGSSWSAFEAVDICYAGGPHDHPLAVSNRQNNKDADMPSSSSSTLDEVDPRLAASFAFPMFFGCQTRLTGLFKTQLADGIMGMDNANTAFWYQMHRAGKISDRVFSLCFSRQDIVNRKGTQAGAMTLGGTDARLHTTPMVYAMNVNGKGTAGTNTTNAAANGKNGKKFFFAVHVRRIYLRQGGGGDSASPTTQVKVVALDVPEADLNRGTTIIDSGTTDTYFTSRIATSLAKVWKDLTGSSYNHMPVTVESVDDLNQLPTILFQLQGDELANGQVLAANQNTDSSDAAVTGLAGSLDPDHPLDVILAVPPSHYMEYDEDTQQYENRFYADEGTSNVLGANAMMGHDVVFDVTNGRIGWAESHCDYAQLLETANIPRDDPEDDGNDSDSTTGSSDSSSSNDKEEEGPAIAKKELPNGDKGQQDDGHGTTTTTVTTSESHTPSGSSSTPCNSLQCRGYLVAAAAITAGIVLLLGLGRIVYRKFYFDPKRGYQLTSEFELSNVVAEDDEDFVEYRDQRNHHDEETADENK